MHRSGAAPLGEQVLILVIGPPVMACLVWLLSRGWASTVQGGLPSERTKRRQKVQFWVVLVVLYIMALGVFLYAWLMRT